MLVLCFCSPVTKHPDFSGEFRMVCCDQTAFSVRAEILAGIETEATQISHGSAALPFIFRAMRLGSIFDHRQAKPTRDFEDRIHVGWISIEMYRKDGFRLR